MQQFAQIPSVPKRKYSLVGPPLSSQSKTISHARLMAQADLVISIVLIILLVFNCIFEADFKFGTINHADGPQIKTHRFRRSTNGSLSNQATSRSGEIRYVRSRQINPHRQIDHDSSDSNINFRKKYQSQDPGDITETDRYRYGLDHGETSTLEKQRLRNYINDNNEDHHHSDGKMGGQSQKTLQPIAGGKLETRWLTDGKLDDVQDNKNNNELQSGNFVHNISGTIRKFVKNYGNIIVTMLFLGTGLLSLAMAQGLLFGLNHLQPRWVSFYTAFKSLTVLLQCIVVPLIVATFIDSVMGNDLGSGRDTENMVRFSKPHVIATHTAVSGKNYPAFVDQFFPNIEPDEYVSKKSGRQRRHIEHVLAKLHRGGKNSQITRRTKPFHTQRLVGHGVQKLIDKETVPLDEDIKSRPPRKGGTLRRKRRNTNILGDTLIQGRVSLNNLRVAAVNFLMFLYFLFNCCAVAISFKCRRSFNEVIGVLFGTTDVGNRMDPCGDHLLTGTNLELNEDKYDRKENV